MHWSVCRNCGVIIEAEEKAVRIHIKRRKIDPHDLSSKRYNFEFCYDCHERLYNEFKCFRPERSKREDSLEKIRNNIQDLIIDYLYGEEARLLASKNDDSDRGHLRDESIEEISDIIAKRIKEMRCSEHCSNAVRDK